MVSNSCKLGLTLEVTIFFY